MTKTTKESGTMWAEATNRENREIKNAACGLPTHIGGLQTASGACFLRKKGFESPKLLKMPDGISGFVILK